MSGCGSELWLELVSKQGSSVELVEIRPKLGSWSNTVRPLPNLSVSKPLGSLRDGSSTKL